MKTYTLGDFLVQDNKARQLISQGMLPEKIEVGQ
jgi:hypothetical protein